MQTYLCKDCGYRFQSKGWKEKNLKKKIFHEYLYHKQTLRELKEEHNLDKRTLKKYLNENTLKEKVHSPRSIYAVVDGTYFGSRKDNQDWCLMVIRDPKKKEDLWWKFGEMERDIYYHEGKEYLEKLGYVFKSITGDGHPSLRRVFSNYTFQICHVHMERIVIRGTTRNPQLEAGKVLLSLVKTLKYTKKKVFLERLENYFEKYKSFFNQKSFSSSTKESWWTHEELRRASYSLFNLSPYLFSFKADTNIHRTTNSLESHFRHLKNLLATHSGLKKENKQRLIHEIMINGSIVPKQKIAKKSR